MEWYHYLLFAVLFAIIEIGVEKMIDYFRSKQENKEKYDALPPLSTEEKLALLKYSALDCDKATLLRLYYSANGYHRILILSNKEHITVRRERLCLFDEEELHYATCYGVWVENEDFYHVYDTEERALKDLERELIDYTEISLHSLSLVS